MCGNYLPTSNKGNIYSLGTHYVVSSFKIDQWELVIVKYSDGSNFP